MKPLATFIAGLILAAGVTTLAQENKVEPKLRIPEKECNCPMVTYPPAEAMKDWTPNAVRREIVAPQVALQSMRTYYRYLADSNRTTTLSPDEIYRQLLSAASQ